MVQLPSTEVIRVRLMVPANSVVDPSRLASDADDRHLIDRNSAVLRNIESEIGRLKNGSHPSVREHPGDTEGRRSLTDPQMTASPLPQSLSDTASAPQWLRAGAISHMGVSADQEPTWRGPSPRISYLKRTTSGDFSLHPSPRSSQVFGPLRPLTQTPAGAEFVSAE
jgi:hypothetical protein